MRLLHRLSATVHIYFCIIALWAFPLENRSETLTKVIFNEKEVSGILDLLLVLRTIDDAMID